jgi:DNA helicase-2/ATP-dependent DNA helicase PcrA
VPCHDADQQAAFVAARLLELRDEGAPLSESAVLYRSHYHSLELQLELTRRGIRMRFAAACRFFEQAHIKDALAYLRVVANPYDELAWKRVLRLIPQVGARPRTALGNDSLDENPLALVRSGAIDRSPENAARVGARFAPYSTALRATKHALNPRKLSNSSSLPATKRTSPDTYENADARLEDLRGLAHYSTRYNSTEEFLAELALLATERYGAPQPVAGEEVVTGADEDEMIALTSVHQAKGLEWRAVFIIWAADGKFPSPAFPARRGRRRGRTPPLVRRAHARARSALHHVPFDDHGLQSPDHHSTPLALRHRDAPGTL